MNILKEFFTEQLEFILFILFAIITIAGALVLLFTKNILHGAFGLLMSFLGVAVMFLFAGADLLAVAQIMIYVGGILVLIIFGIMMSRGEKENRWVAENSNEIRVKHQNQLWAGSLAMIFFIVCLKLIVEAKFYILENKIPNQSSVNQIGRILMTDKVFAFEVIGVLLLLALIGAVFIAKKEKS